MIFKTDTEAYDAVEVSPKTLNIETLLAKVIPGKIVRIFLVEESPGFRSEMIRIDLESGQWILIGCNDITVCCQDLGWASFDNLTGLNGEEFRTIELRTMNRTMTREEEIDAEVALGNFTREEVIEEEISHCNNKMEWLFINICSDRDGMTLAFHNFHTGMYSGLPVRVMLFGADNALQCTFDQEENYDFEYDEDQV